MSALFSRIRKVLSPPLGLLFAPNCFGCGAPVWSQMLCPLCQVLPRLSAPLCRRCGEPLPAKAQTCGYCRHRLPVGIRLLSTQYYYSEITRRLLHQVKFHRYRSLLDAFDPELAEDFLIRLPSGIVIIPVPLSRRSFWRRGFNQSEVLALKLANRHGMEFRNDALIKIRATPAQSTLSGPDRLRNLEDSLTWKQSVKAPRSVLLVDDITTTGATLRACARELRRAGVKWIGAWTLLRSKP